MAGPIEHIPGHEVEEKRLDRAEILQRAEGLINGDRARNYGDAETMHRRIGQAWGAVLNVPAIPAHDVALMMAALKVIRATTADDQDSYVDGSGYLALAAEMK